MIYESLDGKIYKNKEEVFKAVMEHLQHKFNISGNFNNWTEEERNAWVEHCRPNIAKASIASRKLFEDEEFKKQVYEKVKQAWTPEIRKSHVRL